jgi:hypothetical protein
MYFGAAHIASETMFGTPLATSGFRHVEGTLGTTSKVSDNGTSDKPIVALNRW